MSGEIHILRPRGHYIGQIRFAYHQKWKTVTRPTDSAQKALAKAVLKMSTQHNRARALFIDQSGWYDPDVVMEAQR